MNLITMNMNSDKNPTCNAMIIIIKIQFYKYSEKFLCILVSNLYFFLLKWFQICFILPDLYKKDRPESALLGLHLYKDKTMI